MHIHTSTGEGGGVLLQLRPRQPQQVQIRRRGEQGAQVDGGDLALHGELPAEDPDGGGVGENHPSNTQGASTAGPA